MKTRLGSNYSYYQILIVEDAQPITYVCNQSESWNKCHGRVGTLTFYLILSKGM